MRSLCSIILFDKYFFCVQISKKIILSLEKNIWFQVFRVKFLFKDQKLLTCFDKYTLGEIRKVILSKIAKGREGGR